MSRQAQKLFMAAGVVLFCCPLGAVQPAAAQQATPDAPSAGLDAHQVDILIADLGPMARVELKWPVPFKARASASDRNIHVEFDQAFNVPHLGALRHRLGHWITGISKTARTLTFTMADPTGFDTYTDRTSLVMEMRHLAGPTIGIAASTGPSVSGAALSDRPARRQPGQRITLTPPGGTQKTEPITITRTGKKPPSQRPFQQQPPAPVSQKPNENGVKSRLRIGRTAISTTFEAPIARQMKQLVITNNDTAARAAAGTIDQPVNVSTNVQVTSTDDQGFLKLQIDWGAPIGLRSEISGRELIIRLDRPLIQDAFADIGRKNQKWLASVNTGYDSLLLVSRARNKVEISHTGVVTTIFWRNQAADSGENADQDIADTQARRTSTRLELLRARLKARQGNTETARKKLEKLQAENPENTDVTLELAELHRSVGSWQSASGLYDSVLARRPGQFDAVRGKRELDKQNADRIRIDHDVQLVEDGDTQQITRISGHVNVAKRLRIGMVVENRGLEDDQVQRVNGNVQAVDINRQRGEVYGVYQTVPGQRLTVAALLGPASPGLSASYTWQTPRSELTVQGEWHRPHWDFVEGIVDDAVRDTIGARYSRQLDPRWSTEVAFGYNQYEIGNIDDAATSLSAEFAINYLLPVEAADVTVGYSLAGQYVMSSERRLDGGNNPFSPLPIKPTEIHSLNTSVSHRFENRVSARAFASISRDRYQTSIGPTFGGEVTWEPSDQVELGLRGSHSRISGRGDAAIFTRLGGYLLYRF